jgi:putative redox protein
VHHDGRGDRKGYPARRWQQLCSTQPPAKDQGALTGASRPIQRRITAMTPIRITFPGSLGHELAARLDLPAGPVRGYALFAHCFTCSKDVVAARRIAGRLASLGFGVLRFDFTGLGSSEGEFQNTSFSSNVEDLVRAADHLRHHRSAPAILVGHSLGGAAVLAAADRVPEAKAVVTIGAPSDVAHVLKHFQAELEDIGRDGTARVTLSGRTFTITKQFVDDAKGQALAASIAKLRKALLVMHAPTDQIVGVDHAEAIFRAARHPKSFVSLDTADHLLSDRRDAAYAAEVIASWAERYLPAPEQRPTADTGVLVSETGAGRFQNAVTVGGQHHLLADEPVAAGGLDSGPGPYDYLAIALGACTSMTLRVYAEHRKLALPPVTVRIDHGKVPVEHCEDCGKAVEGRTGRIDRFERSISVAGGADPALAAKLIEIANKCPVHRTLEAGAAVVTKVVDRPASA